MIQAAQALTLLIYLWATGGRRAYKKDWFNTGLLLVGLLIQLACLAVIVFGDPEGITPFDWLSAGRE